MNNKILYLLFFVVILSVIMMFLFYKVGPGERVAVVRFGKIIKIHEKTGLYFRFPYPMEILKRVYVNEIKRVEIGFKSNVAEKTFSDFNVEPQLWELKHKSIQKKLGESLVITGDENIVDMNSVIHYQISDVKKYLINFNDPQKILKHSAISIVGNVFGSQSLDDILTRNKIAIQEQIKFGVQKIVNNYDLGISILSVNLHDVHPPIDVVNAFRDVASAREDKNTSIYRALSFRENVLPKARGRAVEALLEAKSYLNDKEYRAKGNISKLLMVKNVYNLNGKYLTLKKYFDGVWEAYKNSKLYVVSPDIFNELEVSVVPEKISMPNIYRE
jgi:membrane protease subunit HflK